MGLKAKILQESFRQFKKSEAFLHPLTYLFWECTLRCNLTCIHCGSDCHTDYKLPDMPAEIFLDQLKDIAAHYNPEDILIVITGGEPLLRKDLPDIGLKIRKLGFRWGLVTNGFALSEALMNQLVNAGLGAITLSFDGLEDEHNWIRNQPKAYEKACQALHLITKYPRINADVVSCVNKRTIHQLPQLYDHLKASGLKAWRLFTITPIGRAKDHPDLELSPDEFYELMEFITRMKKTDRNMEINFSCESYLGTYENKARDGFFFCRAGINIGSILADGGVSACPNIDRALIQGSIYKRSFVDIWENEFQDFRDRSWTKTGICADCKEYKYCQGSGLHWWRTKEKALLRCHWAMLRPKTQVT